jgi:transglutaminase-like putative cysteine protease
MARTLFACLLPALAIAVSWLRIEDPRGTRDALVVVVLGLLPGIVRPAWLRPAAVVAAALGATWIAFGSQPWELLPYRDERVVQPLSDAIGRGFDDFYRVLLPLDPGRTPEMHGLVLFAIFGFVSAVTLLASGGRPIAAAGVAVGGVCWPATLIDGETVALGALALAAALSVPLILRVRSGPSLVAGLAAAALVVAGSAWASSATTVARDAALDWQTWDFGGPAPTRAPNVRFVWDASYTGLEFPPRPTVVLTVEGPERPRYWRASTLDVFAEDRWFENNLWLGRVEPDATPLPTDDLTPPKARRRENWIEQRVEVRALVDDHLVATGTPVALQSGQIDDVFRLAGGTLRVLDPPGAGKRYRVWSYAPDPAPHVLNASKARYPSSADRYRTLASRMFPEFGEPGRDAVVRSMLRDPSYDWLAPYGGLYATTLRIAGSARTPYQAVLALESWFRQRGGFRYDESPPTTKGPPLVAFVQRTRAGYCQHYAGAMTVMLRMLGIPARVAVGFANGRQRDGKWVVTDHDAHAWVEVWFAGHGWVPFDPTPGRATFGSSYSFASESAEAVAALGEGDFERAREFYERGYLPDSADIAPGTTQAVDERPSIVALVLGIAAIWILVVGLGKAIFRRARYVTRDPRRLATAGRRELEEYLRDQGIAVPASATLDDVRRIVYDELGLDGSQFAEAAARARFGPPRASARDAAAARAELRALLRRIRLELSVWNRFRGFVSLRSLRREWQT